MVPYIIMQQSSLAITEELRVLLQWIEKCIDYYFAIIPRTIPKDIDWNQIRVIAHRGAHDHRHGIIENTLAAFRRAQELGCFGIEFDIHATKDNVLIVNHDHTLKRLWGHEKAISDLTFQQLRDLEPNIPTLQEVVSAYGGKMHLFIELKSPFNHEMQLVEALKQLKPIQDYYLLTLDSDIFAKLTRFPRSALCLVPVCANVQSFCDLSITKHYGGVFGSYLLLTQRKFRALKAAQQIFGVGFVDSKFSLYRELAREIHWIFTNNASIVMPHMHRLRTMKNT